MWPARLRPVHKQRREDGLSMFYEIREPSNDDAALLLERLPRLNELEPEVRARALAAWASSWRSSSHSDLDRLPNSLEVPEYSLVTHTNEVTECGLLLAQFARTQWSVVIDPQVLLATLLLHDVDKPLLYTRCGETYALSDVVGEVPHGVLGGLLLKELHLPDSVVTIVTTHSLQSPWHSDLPESWVLYYADFFAADHVTRTNHRRPVYQPPPRA